MSPAEARKWVATVLGSTAVRTTICKTNFKKFDANRNGRLELSEVRALSLEVAKAVGPLRLTTVVGGTTGSPPKDCEGRFLGQAGI